MILNKCMFGSNYVPYEAIGFVVFWMFILATTTITVFATYALWIKVLSRIREWLWEGKNPAKNEQPDGWKLFASFVVHVVWSISKFRTPLFWRWKTYKLDYVSD